MSTHVEEIQTHGPGIPTFAKVWVALLVLVVFQRSEAATREWVVAGLDIDVELLNLVARAQLHYRIISKAKPDFGGLRALLYADHEPPSPSLRSPSRRVATTTTPARPPSHRPRRRSRRSRRRPAAAA